MPDTETRERAGRPRTPSPMPAVLLGGHMNALSVSRTLWRMGVAVDVLDQGGSASPVRSSRCHRRRYDSPAAENPVPRWLDHLLTRDEPSVILPCSDHGLELVARHRDSLETAGHRPIEANDDVVLALLDKDRTYELARKLGVPAPATMTLADTDAVAAASTFTFPAAIKPVNAHVYAQRLDRSPKGTVVRDFAALRRAVDEPLRRDVAMLLTEIVEGSDDCCSYYTYFDEHGEPLTHFTKVKLRQYPTRFGLGTYHVTRWDAEVAELGLEFFRGVGLRGMGNIEFKRDARDGVLKLIEANLRFTNAIELVRASGIDFARLAYARAADLPAPPLDSFRDGMAMWFPADDLRAFLDYRARHELRTTEWVRSLLRPQVPPEFAWWDPLPSVANTGRQLARVTRRIGNTVNRKVARR